MSILGVKSLFFSKSNEKKEKKNEAEKYSRF